MTLPVGFVVELDAGVQRVDDGRALLGGTPARLLRLAPVAVHLLSGNRLTVTDVRTARLARTLLDAGVAHPRPRGGPGPDQVTAVIPVRDNPTGLARLLPTLGSEVIVVDDGSAPPVRVPAYVTLLRHARPKGPAAARNTGLAHARTPYVAFLDSDVTPAPGWLATLLPHLTDPECALVAPRIIGAELGTGWIARYESVRSSLDLGATEAPIVPRARVAYVPSAAMLVRRSALAFGNTGFDESLTVAEDVDLCWRLHAQGWRLRYEPRSQVAHLHRTEPGEWLRRKAFYGTGAAELAARHPGQVPPVVLAPWAAATCLLAATGTRVGLAGAAAITAGATVRLAHRLPVPGLAVHLALEGLVGAAWQLASAAWRHWWPLLGLAAARRPRRVLILAGLAEGIADWSTHRDHRGARPLDPVRYLAAKRLDDLAYGVGLWAGAWRRRSPAALRPHRPGR